MNLVVCKVLIAPFLTKKVTTLTKFRQAEEAQISSLSNEDLEKFCGAMRKKFLDPANKFGKTYIRLLLDKIVVTGEDVLMLGNPGYLCGLAEKTKVGLLEEVPTLGVVWLPLQDSNLRQGD